MPSIHPRVNTVLEPRLYSAVRGLARHDGVSMSQKIRDLIGEALENYEDAGWEKVVLARRRRKPKWVSLEQAEKRLGLR